MISKWKRPYAPGRDPEWGFDSHMAELNELAQAVQYRGARALVAPASKGANRANRKTTEAENEARRGAET